MLLFLRCFSRFRELERERDRNIELQTRMAEQGKVIDWLRREAEIARAGQILAIQTLANYASQKAFGAAPFDDSPRLPDSVVTPADIDPLPAQFIDMGSEVGKATGNFLAKLKERMEAMATQ
jgi:hypothetical protein